MTKRINTLLIAVVLGLTGALASEGPQGDGESFAEPAIKGKAGAPDRLARTRTYKPRVRPAVDGAMEKWRDLFEQTALGSDEANALVDARRQAKAQAVQRLAQGGDDVVPQVLEAYRQTERSREKLVLIEGLGAGGGPAALDALTGLVATEDRFRLREQALRGVGVSDLPQAEDALVDAMLGADDQRLQQIAAQALYGRAGSLDALSGAVLDTGLPMNVRLEAVHGIGGMGSTSALQALQHIASEPTLEARVRVYAEREIVRSFG